MSLITLPTELLLTVGVYMTTLSDLHAISLTSKYLYQVFNSQLYDLNAQQSPKKLGPGGAALEFALENNQTGTLAHCLASPYFNRMALALAQRMNDRSALITLPARHGNAEVIRMLVAHGVDIEHPDDYARRRARRRKKRPLNLTFRAADWFNAARNETAETAAATLVKCGANTGRVWYGATALGAAALLGWSGVVRACLERGADVNAKNVHGDTPLHSALRLLFLKRELVATVKVLVEYEADVESCDEAGLSAVEVAKKRTAWRKKCLRGLPGDYEVGTYPDTWNVNLEAGERLDLSGLKARDRRKAKGEIKEEDRRVVEVLEAARGTKKEDISMVTTIRRQLAKLALPDSREK